MKQILNWGFIVFLIVVLAASEYYTYQSGLATSELVPALLNRDKELFQSLMFKFILLVAISALLSALTQFASNLVAYFIRFEMLSYFLNHFALDDHDFDQRWTQDLDLLSNRISIILTVLIPAPVMILFYWIQSAAVAGQLAPLIVFAYVVVSSGIAGALGFKFPSFIYKKEQLEGRLRVQMVQIRQYKEEIQLYSGIEPEKQMLNISILKLKAVQLKVTIYIFLIDAWSKLVAYIGGILPYFCISIAIFNNTFSNVKSEELAGIIQMAAFLLLMLMNRFTTIIDKFSVVFECAGYYKRVVESIKLFKRDEKTQLTSKVMHNTFGIQNTTARIQDRTIFSKKTLLLHEKSILLIGQNGSGKTTILRVLQNLFPSSHGICIFPKEKTWMILPSRPYFLNGTILDNIIYPLKEAPYTSYKDIERLLESIGLHLNIPTFFRSKKTHWLETKLSMSFYHSLSDGEQQLLCLCRVLYHKPQYLMMDEALSHLDGTKIECFYNLIKAWHCVYLTISHDQQLEEFHDKLVYWTEPNEEVPIQQRQQRFGIF